MTLLLILSNISLSFLLFLTMASGFIIQWNCRGLAANRQELELLAQKYNAPVICLQETNLKDDQMTLKGYVAHHKSGRIDDMNRAHGGVSIFIKSNLPQSVVDVTSPLQAIVVKVTLHTTITFCNLYIPPSTALHLRDLTHLESQLPKPFMIVGDFNSHNYLWGGNKSDAKGNVMETFMTRSNICLFNDDTPTYLHPATGSFTSIDLTMCSPSLFMDFTWRVEEDLHGSDHFPIILKSHYHPPDDRPPKWQFHKADWNLFKNLCLEAFPQDDLDGGLQLETFIDQLCEIANETIPKSNPNPTKPQKPWFSGECKEAILERKRSLRVFKRSPTNANLQLYRIKSAKARQVIRANKKKSWHEYVSKLNARTSMKKCWDMVRKIKGKGGSPSVKHIEKNGQKITQPRDIANTIGEAISFNSSSAHYSSKFQRIKNRQERHPLIFQSDNTEPYNQPFSMDELRTALGKAHDTAPGPDQIHYQILKHLPQASLQCLLKVFNNIWETGEFPPSWREATIIPIAKPGKDSKDPNNYRPIALTSCVCKTMERMINDRLVWYLESSSLITEAQSGFRKTRSTMDHLVRFETFVREGFLKGEHVVSVFFDLEKAYDTTWKYGIMKDLHGMDLRGRLPLFIKFFLSERKFRVRVGISLSDFYDQEMGVPQGSILSVTLFIVKINSITSYIRNGVDKSLFVDDFGVSYRSKHMHAIERQLQLHLNRIEDWAENNGFKFSQSKTVCVHFCRRRGLHPDPYLVLYDNPIPVKKETKFLGILLDSKLTFVPHIKGLKKKCIKALNLLRVVSSTDWGGDRIVLLRLYRALVRSKLDYGCFIYMQHVNLISLCWILFKIKV